MVMQCRYSYHIRRVGSLVEVLYLVEDGLAGLPHASEAGLELLALNATSGVHVLVGLLGSGVLANDRHAVPFPVGFAIPYSMDHYLKRLQLVCMFCKSSAFSLFSQTPRWKDLKRTRQGLVSPSPILVQKRVPVWLWETFWRLIVNKKYDERQVSFSKLPELTILLMLKGSYSFGQMPVLYAQNCPQQPLIIFESTKEPEIPKRASKVLKASRSFQDQMQYKPHIISPKRQWGTGRNWHEASQHKRELASLNQRIRDVKSLSQRKKDRNDPIVYPTYFIRDRKREKDARIDGYYKQLLHKSSRMLAPEVKKNKKSKKGKKKQEDPNLTKSSYAETKADFHPEPVKALPEPIKFHPQAPLPERIQRRTEQVPLPIVRPRPPRPVHDIQWTKSVPNLPECNAQALLHFITDKRVFLNNDLNILRARMVHYYGSEAVSGMWQQVMTVLIRHQPM